MITEYDHDNLYPTFGFGGRSPSSGVSHCFALNGNPAEPWVRGVEGILESYATALTQWGLSGPTIFAQVCAPTLTRDNPPYWPSPPRGGAQVLLIFIRLRSSGGATCTARAQGRGGLVDGWARGSSWC